jgi:hypothetical protein
MWRVGMAFVLIRSMTPRPPCPSTSAQTPTTKPRASGSAGLDLLASGRLGSHLLTWAELAAREHQRASTTERALKPGVIGRIGRSLWDERGPAA